MPTRAETHPLHVAIVGGGMSGLFMASELQDRGIGFTIFEKGDEVGGTWRDNVYPGLFVDVPSSRYQFSSAPKFDWSHAYAPGPEIQRYLLQFTEDRRLRKHIRFGTEVSEIAWDGAGWQLQTRDGANTLADAVVCATGFLHRPALPEIPGMETFEGRWFHSSRWPRDAAVTGKRVGVIGSGSSGIQIVTALAESDCAVTQFVRTPQWIETIRNRRSLRPVQALVRRFPPLGPVAVALMERGYGQDPPLRSLRWKLGPGPRRDRAIRAIKEDLLTIRDPDLRRQLTPDFPVGCKRIPKSPGYYRAVQQPNVQIVRGGIERVEPAGVLSLDGAFHELDVLVYATGFDAHAYMRPARVIGANGATLDEVWGDSPFSYRGVSVPSFPNFFLLHGPFSPINIVPVPTTLDDEVGYICRVIDLIVERRVAAAPTWDATAKFRDRVREALPNTVWGAGCHTWYQGRGDIPVIWPWSEEEHESTFARLAPEDLELMPLREREAQLEGGGGAR